MVHIQDFNNATVEPHWGYADRVVPCKNDPGSCEYLDAVYGAHDVGMTYVGIMWIVILSILLLWAFFRRAFPPSTTSARGKRRASLRALLHRYLLPNFGLPRVFGHATRLQVLLLFGVLAYLAIFSFVGITYKKWVTPIKNSNLHNTRTGLGPFADRVGVLAYALTPLSILLGARESLLSAMTGVPYQQFTFLHRWVGHVILAQSILHTIGWCIIEIRLYQPQPSVGLDWIKQTYMIWGLVAMILLLILWILATPWGQRMTGYEFFRKAHYVLAMVYIGACWGHWAGLKCFLLPSLLLWGADRALRLLRTALIHYRVVGNGTGAFTSFTANITTYTDAARLDVKASVPAAPGQHYFLTFPKGSVWQSHPFTPLSFDDEQLAFIVRCQRGETRRLLSLAPETPVILTGPYGPDISAPRESSVLCIAGGTGIAFVMPVLLRQRAKGPVQLVWCVRERGDVAWVEPELQQLRERGVAVCIHVTRERLTPAQKLGGSSGSSTSDEVDQLALPEGEKTATPTPALEVAEGEKTLALESSETTALATAEPSFETGRCSVERVVAAFLDKASGHTRVYVSGPSQMVAEARHAVAVRADPKAAREFGDDVEFFYDERLD